MKPIPQEWIKGYVESLIEAAKLFDGTMQASIAARADAILDMVKAFRESEVRK
jgi:hypothetical protein